MTIASKIDVERDPPTANELLERARVFTSVLRERAAEAERLNTLPASTVRDLHESGLMRLSQPRRWGGSELGPDIQFDVVATLAGACASTAWIVSNVGGHNQMLAQWSDEAQKDVWGDDPRTLVATSLVFTGGQADSVPGGFRLQGEWPFSSGIDLCDWVIVGALAQEGKRRVARYFLVPRAQFEVLDTWRVSGLRGTGSSDVRIAQIFVPEHRALTVEDFAHNAPGRALNQSPIYRLPLFATGPLNNVATIYGAARGALDYFVEHARNRASRVTGKGVAASPFVQSGISEASIKLDIVRMLARRVHETVLSAATAGTSLDPALLVAFRRDTAYAARLCVQAVDAVMALSGGGGIYDHNPVQRAWRDVHAGAAHFHLQWDVAGPAYGRVLLGQPSELLGAPI